jgi:hypothetical protein
MTQRITWWRAALPIGLAAAMLLAACGGGDNHNDGASANDPVIDPGDGGSYTAELDPDDFVAGIDHPYLPFQPGARWVYESSDGVERIEIEVLAETRAIQGVTATIVRDRVWEEDELVEDTFDWYAQDRAGNVWYLGEDSTEFEDEEPVSTAGSWEAGVDGAQAGIIMQADPAVGQAYRQEYDPGEAEDLAQVFELGASVSVAYGDFDAVLVIREWTPLEPAIIEHKSYARGIGVVLEEKVAGEEGRVELLEFTPGAG